MNNTLTKYDWAEAILLLLLASSFAFPQYFDFPPFVLVSGVILLCFMPIYYVLTFRNYGMRHPDETFPLPMFLWSFLFKCLVLTTFALSFSEPCWVGDISNRSTIVGILFVADRLIMVPYFIVCLCKGAYKEAGVAFVYDLYYQVFGPALTFFMFH